MSVSDWTEGEDGLRRTFRFADFKEAFAFMTEVAMIAERMDHHPEWTNVYGRVDIRLSTHDAGDRVTGRDRRLARAIDDLLARGVPDSDREA